MSHKRRLRRKTTIIPLEAPTAEDMYEVNKIVPELHGGPKDPIGGSADPDKLAARLWIRHSCAFAAAAPTAPGTPAAPITPAGPSRPIDPQAEAAIHEYGTLMDKLYAFVNKMEQSKRQIDAEYYRQQTIPQVASLRDLLPKAQSLDTYNYREVTTLMTQHVTPTRKPGADPSKMEGAVEDVGQGARQTQEGIAQFVGMMDMQFRPETPYLDPTFEFKTLDIKDLLPVIKKMLIEAKNPGQGKYGVMVSRLIDAFSALYGRLAAPVH